MGFGAVADVAGRTSVSLVKADMGSIAGHHIVHPEPEKTQSHP